MKMEIGSSPNDTLSSYSLICSNKSPNLVFNTMTLSTLQVTTQTVMNPCRGSAPECSGNCIYNKELNTTRTYCVFYIPYGSHWRPRYRKELRPATGIMCEMKIKNIEKALNRLASICKICDTLLWKIAMNSWSTLVKAKDIIISNLFICYFCFFL